MIVPDMDANRDLQKNLALSYYFSLYNFQLRFLSEVILDILKDLIIIFDGIIIMKNVIFCGHLLALFLTTDKNLAIRKVFFDLLF